MTTTVVGGRPTAKFRALSIEGIYGWPTMLFQNLCHSLEVARMHWVIIREAKRLVLAIECCVGHPFCLGLWFAIGKVEYLSGYVMSRNSDSPVFWVLWHADSRKGILSTLRVCACIVKDQNMLVIWVPLPQNVHCTCGLFKYFII